ncbi:hypothetical protein [Mariprofundus ferrooxydans]|uniref:Uncharacterized protein n=1 Tax=Mariprofundus ferrooxydans PV-1 TaxID=314345 RepID=Q0F231_9PROT|nr:hypothetical protein [Mariprofundus ferrooxydans]EAU55719.1 hypothetical protein SPV1_02187 [Mariprofundus ferrooxydans PV-1]
MKLNMIFATALLCLYTSTAWALIPPTAPEIDGGLSLQAIGLLAGVLMLMKPKK